MPELTLSLIFPKKNKKLTQLSVNINGVWTFAGMGVPTKIVDNLSIYKINYKFGLLYEGTTSPDSPPVLGQRGDYVSVDPTGGMQIITSSMYRMMYPEKNSVTTKVVSSKSLSDPNFIDKVIKNSNTSEYNKPMSTMRKTSDRPVEPPCGCDKPASKPCNCN